MFLIRNGLYILTAGILWGIISVFVTRLKTLGFDSMQIVAIRVFVSAVVMTLFLLICDREKLRIKMCDIPWFIGTGLGSVAFFNFCYFEAIELIGGAAIPALLLYTAPIFVMTMSLIFFKEKLSVKKVAALVITIMGLVLVTGAFSEGGTSFRAIMLGLGSGFGYALYSIFGKVLAKKYASSTITTFTFVVAAIFIVPFSGVINKAGQLLSVDGIISSTALAVLCTVIPFFLYTKGLSSIEAGKASILAAAEPFTAAFVGIIFFGETMTAQKTIGMLLILGTIILLNIKEHDKKANGRF